MTIHNLFFPKRFAEGPFKKFLFTKSRSSHQKNLKNSHLHNFLQKKQKEPVLTYLLVPKQGIFGSPIKFCKNNIKKSNRSFNSGFLIFKKHFYSSSWIKDWKENWSNEHMVPKARQQNCKYIFWARQTWPEAFTVYTVYTRVGNSLFVFSSESLVFCERKSEIFCS